MTKIQKSAQDARALLAEFERHKEAAVEDPHINPVARLASELFLALEQGEASIEALSVTAAALGDEAFEDRARDFHARRAGGHDLGEALTDLAEKGFDAFRATVERARAGIVFTAHPTFALGAAKRDLIARFPGEDDAALKAWRGELAALSADGQDDITLRYEHDEARKAIENAQAALRKLNAAIIETARKTFPRRWAGLRPNPVSIASWVGYDLDGRSDIHWGESIRIRISEKAAQLRRYEAALGEAAGLVKDGDIETLRSEIGKAAALAEQQAEAFAGDLYDPDVVVKAANLLTGEEEGRLISLAPAIETISAKIEAVEDEDAKTALILLRAEMEACGLGLARIHLRVNAAQVRSALRADLGLDPETGFLGRSALDIAAKKSTAARERAVNFGSVFLEKMTARRQFMLCAEILKHIDADTPIRFLIAECEAPATVMGAIYLARLYGVEKKLDISPLFETPPALESGGRFLERLLREPEYRDYISGRGRMSIQLGFSDSGRFMGQCAAGLAVERLQVLFARALAEAEMTDIEALVFNTHGESMGRGAHPGSFQDRLNHLSTPWVRSRFARAGIPLAEECSFQGGEGYLHFQSPALSEQTLNLVWSGIICEDEGDEGDRFYRDINYSWDFYRGLKSWQEQLFQRADYRHALSGFPQRFLFKTGSRKAKRAKGGGFDLSALRAIPHNAILQQLGAPANVACGFGMAAGREPERLVEHIDNSGRMRALTSLAARARSLTDLSVLRAYATLYAPHYWSSLAVAAGTSKRADAYEAAQEALGAGETSDAFHRLTDFLSQDLRRFDAILEVEGAGVESAHRDRLSALHAIRQALMAKAVSLVAGAPPFSRRHDIAHEDLIEMVLDWRLEETIETLGEIFPARAPANAAFESLKEQVEDHAFEGGAYPEIHADIIAPLRDIAVASRTLSQAIANHYGAFG
ncbi:phosphoenolpyruvate carboxylase [Hyphococcus luteus]|uniref:Phosphoenolpyruvate carboxylase n=1 Tax=Hyphococcus luteus TaxID=2058213 RepID=A0A2S7KAX3_9PROT|nr:phosphoenolpyruvate carboxylase [Marinicaulis flavus]PQA89664.1 phosphoenolpyruvate carboxylase [Marinicaulis flavus]